jgi:hypothetical protein
MNRFKELCERAAGSELERVIEPLASYICATERPKDALMSALSLLFREVEGTHAAALAHFQNWRQN